MYWGLKSPRPASLPKPHQLPRLPDPFSHPIDRHPDQPLCPSPPSSPLLRKPQTAPSYRARTSRSPTNAPRTQHARHSRPRDGTVELGASRVGVLTRGVLGAHARQDVFAGGEGDEEGEGDKPDAETKVGGDFGERREAGGRVRVEVGRGRVGGWGGGEGRGVGEVEEPKVVV